MSVYAGPNTIQSGLVLHIDPNNPRSYPGAGSALFDISGQSNNGTLTNGAAVIQKGVGRVLNFDGANDQIIIEANSILQFSIWSSFWFNLTTNIAAGTTRYTLINTSAEATSPFRSPLYVGFNIMAQGPSNNTQALNVLTYDGSFGGSTSQLSGAYTTKVFTGENGKWFHVSCGWTGSAWEIYINGVKDTNAQNPQRATTTPVSAPCLIGGSASRFTPVMMDDIRIYNRPLSIIEILQNYHATKGRYGL
jgi:hypothetical protein